MMSLFIHFLEALTFCLVVVLIYRLHSAYKQSLLEDASQSTYAFQATDSRASVDTGSRSSALRERLQSGRSASDHRGAEQDDGNDPVMSIPVMQQEMDEVLGIARVVMTEHENTESEPEVDARTEAVTFSADNDVQATVTAKAADHEDARSDPTPKAATTDGAENVVEFTTGEEVLGDYIGDFFAAPLDERPATDDDFSPEVIARVEAELSHSHVSVPLYPREQVYPREQGYPRDPAQGKDFSKESGLTAGKITGRTAAGG